MSHGSGKSHETRTSRQFTPPNTNRYTTAIPITGHAYASAGSSGRCSLMMSFRIESSMIVRHARSMSKPYGFTSAAAPHAPTSSARSPTSRHEFTGVGHLTHSTDHRVDVGDSCILYG